MTESRAPSLLNGTKLSPTLKFMGLVVAAVASAFGTVQIAPNNQAAESAQEHAVRADEKADLAYQLLGQKVDYENRAINKRIDHLEDRLLRIEQKIDQRNYALGVGRPEHTGRGVAPLGGGLAVEGAGEDEAEMAEPDPVATPQPEPSEQRVALPSTLDAAYRSSKAGHSGPAL